MVLAGLWENWKSPEGEWMRSFAIITTTPNELCARLHNRMPVILKPEAWSVWLGEEPSDASALEALLAPLHSKEMTCWPVSAINGTKTAGVSFGGRPICCPRFCARLRPSAVRVRIRSRSTSANPPNTAIISRPVLVPVSAHGSARERNCASASTIC